MTEQMTIDFDRRIKNRRNPNRPHHRTTILTTNRKTYERAKALNRGWLRIEAVNDIVSSARGGQNDEHHMLRRSALIRRQIEGGYRKVKVRADNTDAIECRLVDLKPCSDDECSFFVVIGR